MDKHGSTTLVRSLRSISPSPSSVHFLFRFDVDSRSGSVSPRAILQRLSRVQSLAGERSTNAGETFRSVLHEIHGIPIELVHRRRRRERNHCSIDARLQWSVGGRVCCPFDDRRASLLASTMNSIMNDVFASDERSYWVRVKMLLHTSANVSMRSRVHTSRWTREKQHR